MKAKKIMPIFFICSFLLCGCWDSIEINRKAFISTIAVDVGSEIFRKEEFKNSDGGNTLYNKDIEKLQVIFGYPDMSQLGPEKGTTATEKILKVGCYSMSDGVMKASSKSSRDINMGHSKLFIFTKELLQNEDIFKEVIDYLKRESTINRNTNVVIFDGRAEEFLRFKPEMEKNIEEYINGLIENSKRNSTIVPIDLNTAFKSEIENNAILIPIFKLDEGSKEIILSGTTLIKNFKYNNTLSNEEISNVSIIRGETKGGKRVMYKEKTTIDYVVDNVERELKVKLNESNKLIVDIELRIVGQLKNYQEGKEVFNNHKIKELEAGFNNSLKEELLTTIKRTKEDFNIDLFGVKDYIQKYNPKIWNEIKADWDNKYSQSEFNLKIDTQIGSIGIIK